jgi:hypothetical protein
MEISQSRNIPVLSDAFRLFLLVARGKFRHNTSIRLQSLPFKLFQFIIHLPSYHSRMYTSIDHHLWNPKVHYAFTKVQHLFLFCARLILSVSSNIIFEVHFNIILNYMPCYPKWSILFAISARSLWIFTLCILLRVYFSSHVRYMAPLTDRAVTVK